MSIPVKLVQVEIFGQIYNLRAEDDGAYVESLAAYVDRKMREVSRQTKNVDTLKVAILAALNIADEARSGRGGAHADPPAAGKDHDRRSAELVRILDEALAG
jgi:cell division protein ZapA